MIDEAMGLSGMLLAVSALVLTFIVIIASLVKPEKKMKSRKYYWKSKDD